MTFDYPIYGIMKEWGPRAGLVKKGLFGREVWPEKDLAEDRAEEDEIVVAITETDQ